MEHASTKSHQAVASSTSRSSSVDIKFFWLVFFFCFLFFVFLFVFFLFFFFFVIKIQCIYHTSTLAGRQINVMMSLKIHFIIVQNLAQVTNYSLFALFSFVIKL